MTTNIDNSQRTAAKVAGIAGILGFILVVFGNYVLLDPLIVPRNAVETLFELVVSFWLLSKGLKPRRVRSSRGWCCLTSSFMVGTAVISNIHHAYETNT